MCKTKTLKEEVPFWKFMAERLTEFFETMSTTEKKEIQNRLEGSFTDYIENYLKGLIDRINNKKLDKTLTTQDGFDFQSVINCKYVREDLRKELCEVVFDENYVQNLINDIKSGNVDIDFAMDQCYCIQTILDNTSIPEALRDELCQLFFGGDERNKRAPMM